MTTTAAPDETTVEPITDFEQWCVSQGAKLLAANGELSVKLDADAAALEFTIIRSQTGLEVRRLDGGGRILFRTTAINHYVLASERRLGEVMYERAGEVIASAVRYKNDPDNLDLVMLSEHERYALPPVWHRPVWYDLPRPALWMCQVCWGDGIMHQWPCAVAARHGLEIAKSLKLPYTR